MFLSQVCKFSTKAPGGHCLPVCLNETSAPSALRRGGVRAGAFPVVEGLRLALLASAGASRRSCAQAGGNVTGSGRHLFQTWMFQCRYARRGSNCTSPAGNMCTCVTFGMRSAVGAGPDRRSSRCSALFITFYFILYYIIHIKPH